MLKTIVILSIYSVCGLAIMSVFIYMCNITDSTILKILYWLLQALLLIGIIGILFRVIDDPPASLMFIMITITVFSAFGVAGFNVRVSNYLTKNVVRNVSVNEIDKYPSSTVFYFSDGVMRDDYKYDYYYQQPAVGRSFPSVDVNHRVVPIVDKKWNPSDTIKVWGCYEGFYSGFGSLEIWKDSKSGYELSSLGKERRVFFEKIIKRHVTYDNLVSSPDAKLIIISLDPEKDYVRRERLYYIILITTLLLTVLASIWFEKK